MDVTKPHMMMMLLSHMLPKTTLSIAFASLWHQNHVFCIVSTSLYENLCQPCIEIDFNGIILVSYCIIIASKFESFVSNGHHICVKLHYNCIHFCQCCIMHHWCIILVFKMHCVSIKVVFNYYYLFNFY